MGLLSVFTKNPHDFSSNQNPNHDVKDIERKSNIPRLNEEKAKLSTEETKNSKHTRTFSDILQITATAEEKKKILSETPCRRDYQSCGNSIVDYGQFAIKKHYYCYKE